MNETHTKAVSIPLLTFRQGSNNFYDSTFSVPLNFKPNARGLYNVQINEVIFHNNEEVLKKNDDWIKYTVYWSDDTITKNPDGSVVHSHPPSSRIYKMKTNVLSTQRAPNDQKIIAALSLADAAVTATGLWQNNRGDEDAITGMSIELYEPTISNDTKIENGNSKRVTSVVDYMVMKVKISGPNPDGNKVKGISIQASNNFLYMFGNLFNEWTGTETPEYMEFTAGDCAERKNNVRYFELHNLRRSGPFVYVVDTNINTPVKTINENGQTYNVMARSYNTATYHNEIIQCNSTMTGTVKDLTNLRIRILNDFMEPLNIHNPVYVNLTVSNSD